MPKSLSALVGLPDRITFSNLLDPLRPGASLTKSVGRVRGHPPLATKAPPKGSKWCMTSAMERLQDPRPLRSPAFRYPHLGCLSSSPANMSQKAASHLSNFMSTIAVNPLSHLFTLVHLVAYVRSLKYFAPALPLIWTSCS